MGQVVKDLPDDMAKCTDISGDLAKITAWGDVFWHPLDLVTTLYENLWTNWS